MGIDIGTSSVRAVVFDRNGATVTSASIEYSLLGTNGVAELRPDEIFHGMICCVRECADRVREGGSALSGGSAHSGGGAGASAAAAGAAGASAAAAGAAGAGRIAAVGISCQMHSLLCVDAKGQPLTNAITWADTRATAQADEIQKSGRVDALYRISGCRVQHPMYPLAKVRWLQQMEPDTFKATYKFITIKEYILYRLFGEYVVDFTLAASQGYFDINKNQWSDEILREVAGIDQSRLSQVVECTHVLRGMAPEYAREMGMGQDVPFVIGSGDGIMANLGCGVVDDTTLSATIGTSGAVRTSVKKPLLDSAQRTWCYSFTKDTWVAGGATNSGGIALKYLRERFGAQLLQETGMAAGQEYEAMDVLAARVPAGSDGLVFLPYLMGERSPDWNPNVRGLIGGLELSHGNGHICRAAMEGVIFRLYSVYEVMAAINANARQIRATGGIVKSPFWMQIQADIFGKEILVPGTQEGAALGAAFTAMVAVKAVPGFGSLLEAMQPVDSINPDMAAHERYRKFYQRAMALYEATTSWQDNRDFKF